jgi:hypothetical protein
VRYFNDNSNEKKAEPVKKNGYDQLDISLNIDDINPKGLINPGDQTPRQIFQGHQQS